MNLSQYLEMKLAGELIWPQLNFMGPGGKVLSDVKEIEESVLKKVSLRKTVEYYSHLDIEVEFDGRAYSTSFLWDDRALLRSLYDILSENITNSIKDIGNLEVPSAWPK